MEQSGAAVTLSWTCPSCGRRVPRRVGECRCGFQQPEATVDVESTPAISAPAPATAERSSSGRMMFLAILVFIAGGIAAMLVMRQGDTAPPAAAETKATVPPPAASPVALPVAE